MMFMYKVVSEYSFKCYWMLSSSYLYLCVTCHFSILSLFACLPKINPLPGSRLLFLSFKSALKSDPESAYLSISGYYDPIKINYFTPLEISSFLSIFFTTPNQERKKSE